jgi:alpha-N-acetylglucosamine transferase
MAFKVVCLLLFTVVLSLIFLTASLWHTSVEIKPQLHRSNRQDGAVVPEAVRIKESAPSAASSADLSFNITGTLTSTPTNPRSPSQAAAIQPPYAYVFYATDIHYACSALVNVQRLLDLRTMHHIHLLVSPTVDAHYLRAFEALSVTVTIREPLKLPGGSRDGYYDDCLLKLEAFRMHEIDPYLKRVIVLDADQLVTKSLDSLFELPSADLATPRAYWLGSSTISSTLMVIEPSSSLWSKVETGIASLKPHEYDMDLVNQLFNGTVLMLPGSYVTLNSHWEDWNLPGWFRDVDAEVETIDDVRKRMQMEKLGFALKAVAKVPMKDGSTFLIGSNVESKRQLVDVPAIESFDPLADARATETESGIDASIEAISHVRETLVVPKWTHQSAMSPTGPVYDDAWERDADQIAAQVAEAEAKAAEARLPPGAKRESLVDPLNRLYRAAYVLHFTAVGKPWQWRVEDVEKHYPSAHPVLYQQIKAWRDDALKVCPLAAYGSAYTYTR